MKKRLLSIALSLLMLFSALPPMSVSAASYADTLRSKGFSQGYIDALVALHKQYPNWKFEPMKTGLNWKDAVSGERSTHTNQIIDKSSEYGDQYYCSCEKCKPNGSYRYVYSGCVSASRWAVEYFMDPRNWLDEKHIFQFQSHAYSSSDTQSGVEAILKPTFMYKAAITYKNGDGEDMTYKNSDGKTVKFSKAMMEAAKNSGLSAYYIASRIVKEVGATKPSVAGTCGTRKPFTGIYNYYSIGASSGAMSGLEFASGYLRTEKKSTLYADYDTKTKKGTGKETALAAKQYMSFISSHGDYYKVRLYSQSSYASGIVGYVEKADLRTTYFNYNRPWTNPYKAIYGGAAYIAKSYLKYQYTTYLEKFNVNSASGSLYSHEYMQNINAISTEAESTYKAYKNAGVLSAERTFYIPVFNNMPNSTETPTAEETPVSAKPTGLKLTGSTVTTLSVRWNAVENAAKYYVLVHNLTKETKFHKTVTGTTATVKNLTPGNKYRLRVRAYVGGKWHEYSSRITARAAPMKGKITKISSPNKGKIYTAWKKRKGASGYQVKYARDKAFKKTVANKTFSASTLSHTGKNFTKGVTYYIKVRAYTTVNGKKIYGKWSAVKSVKSK